MTISKDSEEFGGDRDTRKRLFLLPMLGTDSWNCFGGAGENRTHDRGFADLGLTTWLPRRFLKTQAKQKPRRGRAQILERETGFEPATSTLARSHSTAELLPLNCMSINEHCLARQTSTST
jgi:hypothetical protein